jgi:ABC-type polar amino acid transport system ATPase subunit
MGHALTLAGVSKRFGSIAALDSVSLETAPGQVVSIIGPSGAGKTTLLRCIGLQGIDEGCVRIGSEVAIIPQSGEAELRALRNSVGHIFQEFHLWPHKTVLENVCLAPIMVKGAPKHVAAARALGLLERFGLQAKAASYPDSLSGGQKQRVAIARALAMEPKVLLMDEITSALDPELAGSVARMVRELAREGTTILAVTHDMNFAADVSDRIVFLDRGRIVEMGTPSELLLSPKSSRMRDFLGALVRTDI